MKEENRSTCLNAIREVRGTLTEYTTTSREMAAKGIPVAIIAKVELENLVSKLKFVEARL